MGDAVPPCAHRCGSLQARFLQIVRLTGVDERVVRLAAGVTPEYVPPTPLARPGPRTVARCAACGHAYEGPGAVITARECADLDTGATD